MILCYILDTRSVDFRACHSDTSLMSIFVIYEETVVSFNTKFWFSKILKELRKRDVELSPEITLKNIDKLIESFAMDREEIFNQPRRHCMLKEYPDQSPEILGKVWLMYTSGS